MKIRRLPPLHALEAFESTARHKSLRQAAESLHLTPSAVSHQISTIEVAVGAKLFRKVGRGVALTDAGRRYLETVTHCLSSLREAGRSLAPRAGPTPRRLCVPATIASEVLMPALPLFWRDNPGIELRIETTRHPMIPLRDDVDVVVCYGAHPREGYVVQHLLTVHAVPVCAPALAKSLSRRTPADLSDVALIHCSLIPNEWPAWAKRARVTLGKPKQDISLDSYLAVLRAAEQGVGLALGALPVINPLLRTGRLAMPWPRLSNRHPKPYLVVHRKSDQALSDIVAICRWLRRTVKALSRVRA